MDDVQLKITNPDKHLTKAEAMTPEKKAQTAKAAKDFETVLTGMMLKSMTSNTGGLLGGADDGEGGGGSGNGSDMYDSLFQNNLAAMMSKSSSLGIAEKIYKQITGEDLPAEYKNKSFPGSPLSPALRKQIQNIPVVTPSMSSMQRLEKFDNITEEASQKYGVNKNLIKAIILAESAGNEKAVSKAGAKGLMQLMDGTASNMGVRNSFNPKDNIMGGSQYISQMLSKYNGDIKLALAAYNAGPGNVDKYKGVPPFEETKTYVTRVMGYLKTLET